MPNWLDIAGKIFKVAGPTIASAGQAAAQNRGAKTAATLDRDQLGIQANRDYESALENRAKLDLDQRQTAAALQSDAYRKALQSAMLLNWSPVARPAGVANISFVGSGAGPQGRAAAEALNRAVTLKLLSGEQFDPLPAVQKYQIADLPKTGTLERLAGILGPSLTGLGALSELTKKKTPNPRPPYDLTADTFEGE